MYSGHDFVEYYMQSNKNCDMFLGHSLSHLSKYTYLSTHWYKFNAILELREFNGDNFLHENGNCSSAL